jgi:hypothetical protein
MIVLWHIVIHGIIVPNPQLPLSEELQLGGALSFICYHVDTFILISGYYGIKLRKQSFLNYCFQIFFYVIIAYILYLYLENGREGLSKFDIRLLFPFHFQGLWFAKNYLFLMLLAPFFNYGSSLVSKNTFITIILTLFIYQQITIDYDSTSELHFFLMYLIGRYLNLYPIGCIERYSVALFVIGLLLLFSETMFSLLLMDKDLHFVYSRICSYTNPIVIATSICCFVSFKNIVLQQSRIVNFLAKGSFAVYLFTDGFLRKYFTHTCFDICGECIPLLLSSAILVTITLSLADFARRYLFAVICSPIREWYDINKKA